MRIDELNWFDVESYLEKDDRYEWDIQRGAARRFISAAAW